MEQNSVPVRRTIAVKTGWLKDAMTEARYHGPMCRCGARSTARIGNSALTRQCQSCGQTYAYRLKDGILVPYALETALALEGK